MSESLSYPGAPVASRDRTHTLFGQTMGYVAVTTGFFALFFLRIFSRGN